MYAMTEPSPARRCPWLVLNRGGRPGQELPATGHLQTLLVTVDQIGPNGPEPAA